MIVNTGKCSFTNMKSLHEINNFRKSAQYLLQSLLTIDNPDHTGCCIFSVIIPVQTPVLMSYQHIVTADDVIVINPLTIVPFSGLHEVAVILSWSRMAINLTRQRTTLLQHRQCQECQICVRSILLIGHVCSCNNSD